MAKDLSELLKQHCVGREIILSKGRKLFERGQKAGKIYSISSGKIRLVRATQEGNTAIMHIGLSGETIAEAALFSDVYHCDAIVDEESTVIAYDTELIIDALKQDANLSLRLVECLSRQVQQLRTLAEIRSIRSARNRIIEYLEYIAHPEKTAKIPGTLKDCACRLGLTHETFYRKLAELENNAEIRRDGLHLTLLNR